MCRSAYCAETDSNRPKADAKRHSPDMPRLAWALLATPLFLGGCFSDPPSSSSASDGSTTDDVPGSTSSTSASSTGVGSTTDDATSASDSTGEDSTTEGAGDETEADTTSTTMGATEFDLFMDCNVGSWRAEDEGSTVEVHCDNTPRDENTSGGVWQFPMLDTTAFGDAMNALVLRPYPSDNGALHGVFHAGRAGFADGGHLQFDWEVVNTILEDEVSRTQFRVFIQPGAEGANPILVIEEAGPAGSGLLVGASGTVDIPLELMGPGDDLVFSVTSTAHVSGRGFALLDARIVP